MNILTDLRSRAASQEGATATEYIFLLVFIAIAITVGAGILGGQINGAFSDGADEICDNEEIDCTTR